MVPRSYGGLSELPCTCMVLASSCRLHVRMDSSRTGALPERASSRTGLFQNVPACQTCPPAKRARPQAKRGPPKRAHQIHARVSLQLMTVRRRSPNVRAPEKNLAPIMNVIAFALQSQPPDIILAEVCCHPCLDFLNSCFHSSLQPLLNSI